MLLRRVQPHNLTLIPSQSLDTMEKSMIRITDGERRKLENILQLPLEIRREIYSHLLPDFTHPIFCLCKCQTDPAKDQPSQLCQSPAILQKSYTLQQEFRESLTAIPLHIVCRSEYAVFRSSVPCLNILSGSPLLLPSIHMILTPFLLGSSISHAFSSLIRICTFLNRAHNIPKLFITIDGLLPRTEPPWLIGEIEIERAPLIIALLLEPFTLLCNKVAVASIAVEGGPINAPWAAMPLIREHAAYIEAKMTKAVGGGQTQECRSRERISNIQGLIDDEGALWSLLSRPDGAFDKIVGDPNLSGFRCDRLVARRAISVDSRCFTGLKPWRSKLERSLQRWALTCSRASVIDVSFVSFSHSPAKIQVTVTLLYRNNLFLYNDDWLDFNARSFVEKYSSVLIDYARLLYFLN